MNLLRTFLNDNDDVGPYIRPGGRDRLGQNTDRARSVSMHTYSLSVAVTMAKLAKARKCAGAAVGGTFDYVHLCKGVFLQLKSQISRLLILK